MSGSALPGGAQPVVLTFESHGAFFSRETHQAVAIDPQVFVRRRGAPGGVGPQGIAHIAGLTPAPLSDPPATPLYTAAGKPLRFTPGGGSGHAARPRSIRLADRPTG